MGKRIFLFLVTNLAIVLTLTLVVGFTGSFISLLMSKSMAKWSTGAQVISQPSNAMESWLVEVVRRHAQKAGIGMPEVAIFEGDPNAFATGAFKNSALVAVSTGLLQSMSKEEVEAVLGHEIGHYLQRDSVERLRDAKSRSSFGLIVGLALGAVGGGSVGSLAQMGILAGGLAYGRDQERVADKIGIALMARNGYAPAEAGRVWGQLLEEAEGAKAAGEDVSSTNILFASHPPAEERREVLAAAAKRDWPGAARTGADEYRAALAPHRMGFLYDEVRRRRFGESLVLFDRLLKSSPRDGQVQYFKGEAYRQRGREGDTKLALEAYRAALEMDSTPPEVHRSLGTVLRQAGENAEATRAFQRYLELKPGAEDAELIRSYLTGSQS